MELGNQMNIGSLESFVLFSELGSFAKVAEKCCRTNAAISAQMKRLEEEYNAQLFEKKGRHLGLTAAGEQLLHFAQTILELNREAKDRLREQDSVIELVIGSPSDYVNSHLLSIIDQISGTLDNVHTKLIIRPSSELKELWLQGAVDIALYSSPEPTGLGALVAPVDGVWVAADTFEATEHSYFTLVLYDENCLFHQNALKGLREKGTAFKVHSTTSDSHTICHLVENKGMVAAMAEVSMRPTMKTLDDPRLPRLPRIYLKLLVSQRLKHLDAKNLVYVMKAVTRPDGSEINEDLSTTPYCNLNSHQTCHC